MPKSENDTHPVVFVGKVSFPDPESMAFPVWVSIEPVNRVELHVEGTRQIEEKVHESVFELVEFIDVVELEDPFDREVRLPHAPLYVNTYATKYRQLSLTISISSRSRVPRNLRDRWSV